VTKTISVINEHVYCNLIMLQNNIYIYIYIHYQNLSSDSVPNTIWFNKSIESYSMIHMSISTSFETKQFFSRVFLDISVYHSISGFWSRMVWHFLFKLKNFIPFPYFQIIKSYVENRLFSKNQYSIVQNKGWNSPG